MSRSQRHKILVSNYPADCKITAEHVITPAYLRQGAGPFVVPVGPTGGPLQGSSLAGPAPTLIPNPQEGFLLPTRSFPIGPILLASVSYDSTDGELVFVMADGDGNAALVQVGDTVRVEATGTTSVNIDYVVTALSDPPGSFWVAGDDPGNGPILNKGRVTIISGA